MALEPATGDELAGQVHDAVQQLAGVAGVGSGRRDQILTYLPGSTIAGVVVDDATITIEVVGTYPPAGSYVELAGVVRARVRQLAPTHDIDVTISDIRTEA